ncbi:hypothetical protein J1614_007046 [Plenodomus biglobosus]|nr:hypothetical protein J1614_007046 [Plenodomus biglobosus]
MCGVHVWKHEENAEGRSFLRDNFAVPIIFYASSVKPHVLNSKLIRPLMIGEELALRVVQLLPRQYVSHQNRECQCGHSTSVAAYAIDMYGER